MNNSFLTAAASYYGISPEILVGGDWQNDNGSLVLTFTVRANEDDLQGILSRMKAIREEEEQRQPEQPQQIAFATEDIRKHYDKLTPTERSQYGSFGCFKHAVLSGVSSIEVDDDNDTYTPHIDGAVWLTGEDISDAQMASASGWSQEQNRYLVPWSMLTDEQKVKASEVKP